MAQTPDIAVYGGFGSNDYQVNKMCEQISDYTGCEAEGMSFDGAIGDPERAAELLHDHRVVTHSAGAMAVSMAMTAYPDATPENVLAIAPPYPVPAWKLIWRARQILGNEFHASRHDRDLAFANIKQTGALTRELVQHARGNFGEIPAISRFNVFQFGSQLAERGIDTQVAFMEDDEFFSPKAPKFRHYLGAVDQRIEVMQIPGYHCEFAQNPRRALGNIAIAQAITNEPAAPDLASLPMVRLPALAPV